MFVNINFILASKSPRRKELLAYLGIPFIVRSVKVDESISSNFKSIDKKDNEHSYILAQNYAVDIAQKKGEALIETMDFNIDKDNYIILSADTIVYLEGQILAKPKDIMQAREILLTLSGKKHRVLTAYHLFLIIEGKRIKDMAKIVESVVTFEKISQETLEIYLKTNESLDKAGAYGIQGSGLSFISCLSGSYSNVVGLPLSDVLYSITQILGIDGQNEKWRHRFK